MWSSKELWVGEQSSSLWQAWYVNNVYAVKYPDYKSLYIAYVAVIETWTESCTIHNVFLGE